MWAEQKVMLAGGRRARHEVIQAAVEGQACLEGCQKDGMVDKSEEKSEKMRRTEAFEEETGRAIFLSAELPRRRWRTRFVEALALL